MNSNENTKKGMKSGDKIVIAIIILAAIGLFAFMFLRPTETDDGPYALISVNSRVYQTIDLGTTESGEYSYFDAGVEYTVEVLDGEIRMKHIDCPDEVCIATGWTNSTYLPVICLPNKVSIEVYDNPEGASSTSEDGGVDVSAG